MAAAAAEANRQLDPANRPDIDCAEAQRLTERLYGITVHLITELDSFDDRNFRIRVIDDVRELTTDYVLKITNSLDSAAPGLVEATNEISMFVGNSIGMQVPIPVPNLRGGYVSRERLPRSRSESEYAIRLMKFVQGTIINTVEYSQTLLFDVGSSVGRMTQCLQGFDNPVLAARDTIWSLRNVSKLGNFLVAINDQQQVEMIRRIIRKFQTEVDPVIDSLPTSIIHGDLNEQNIVVELEPGLQQYRFAGVIDFCDAHKAPAVFDLAILCAYLTLDIVNGQNPLDCIKYIVTGYESVLTLTEQEFQILPTLILARFAQSVTLGTYVHRNDPDNAFILSLVRKTGRVMRLMLETDERELLRRWRDLD